MSVPVYVILGISGCGKGTQAKLLADKLNVPAVSTGEILREAMKTDTPDSKEARSYVVQGKWVPEALFYKLVMPEIEKRAQKGLVLEGMPRTLDQANYLDGWFADRNMAILNVLMLQTSQAVALERIQGRIDQSQDAKDVRQDEQNVETIKQRFVAFEETIAPILTYYKAQGKLLTIDNTPAIAAVHESIVKSLGLSK